MEWSTKDVTYSQAGVGGLVKAGGSVISAALYWLIKYIRAAKGHDLRPFLDPKPNKKPDPKIDPKEESETQGPSVSLNLKQLIADTYKLEQELDEIPEIDEIPELDEQPQTPKQERAGSLAAQFTKATQLAGGRVRGSNDLKVLKARGPRLLPPIGKSPDSGWRKNPDEKPKPGGEGIPESS